LFFIAMASTLVATVMPATSIARDLQSEYTDISSCKADDDGQDSFILNCEGPGSNGAVLQYMEGRAGLIFTPSMHGKELDNADLIELSPNANKVFSGKIEWRIGADAQPCAAIIRLPTSQGSRLIVTDLKLGRRVAQVKSNEEAHKVSDNACGKSTVTIEQPVPQQSGGAGGSAWLKDSIVRGETDFEAVFKEEGMDGAETKVDACYKSQMTKISDAAYCASMDLAAEGKDEAFAQVHNMPRVLILEKPIPESDPQSKN
jgi:hypothetical protein